MSATPSYTAMSPDEECSRIAGAVRGVLRRADCQEQRGIGHPQGERGGFAVYHDQAGALVLGCVRDPSLNACTERQRYEAALRAAGYRVARAEDTVGWYLLVQAPADSTAPRPVAVGLARPG